MTLATPRYETMMEIAKRPQPFNLLHKRTADIHFYPYHDSKHNETQPRDAEVLKFVEIARDTFDRRDYRGALEAGFDLQRYAKANEWEARENPVYDSPWQGVGISVYRMMRDITNAATFNYRLERTYKLFSDSLVEGLRLAELGEFKKAFEVEIKVYVRILLLLRTTPGVEQAIQFAEEKWYIENRVKFDSIMSPEMMREFADEYTEANKETNAWKQANINWRWMKAKDARIEAQNSNPF